MTNKEIEALKVLSENVRHKAGIEFGGLRDNETTRSAIVTLMEFARAALEAKAEPVKCNEFFVLYDATTDKKFIKKDTSTGALAFFDYEHEAKAAKARQPGTDYQKQTLYNAPPTTAEVKAQALEEMACELKQCGPAQSAEHYAGLLTAKAKRLREEG